MKKIRVGIIFGGRSPEHEISLLSARNVINSLDRQKYEVVLIGIDKQGRWLLPDQSEPFLRAAKASSVCINTQASLNLALLPSEASELIINKAGGQEPGKLDVIFPVLHGTMGEDGTIQGLLQFVGIAFVGAGVLSSAVCMDKEISKYILQQAGLPVVKFICLHSHDKNLPSYAEVSLRLGSPVFVKPANTGSSVGVSKVANEAAYQKALAEAFKYDHKILIEEAIIGREIEISVLGNDYPEVSVVGEVIPNDEFYTYKAKYEENGARLVVPADLPAATVELINAYAKKAFLATSCRGMARIDFFVRGEEVYINELNTIPGFTNSSAYTLLWQHSGLNTQQLVDRLIALALEAHNKDKGLKRSYTNDQ